MKEFLNEEGSAHSEGVFMKDSEFLKIARDGFAEMIAVATAEESALLEDTGVCFSFSLAYHEIYLKKNFSCRPELIVIDERLRRWIYSQLGGHVYLYSWVVERMPEVANLSLMERRIKLQETRLAWLDWMIAECEKAEAV